MAYLSIKSSGSLFLMFLLLLSILVFMPTAMKYSKEEINITEDNISTVEIEESMYTIQGLSNESKVKKNLKIFIGSYLGFLEEKAMYYGQKYPYPKMWSVLTRLILIVLIFCFSINSLNKIVSLRNL